MNEKVSPLARVAQPPRSEAERLRLQRMFAAHHPTVWRVLRRRGLSPDLAEDATQQTFLVAAERLNDIEPACERAFLIGTALRVARGLRRKTSRLDFEDDLDERVAGVGNERVDLELCDIALSKLNPELAEAFVLFEIEGFSSAELATMLDIPMGSVASRLRRAREQFRAAFARLERRIAEEAKRD